MEEGEGTGEREVKRGEGRKFRRFGDRTRKV
jgi:hypothetical protein